MRLVTNMPHDGLDLFGNLGGCISVQFLVIFSSMFW